MCWAGILLSLLHWRGRGGSRGRRPGTCVPSPTAAFSSRLPSLLGPNSLQEIPSPRLPKPLSVRKTGLGSRSSRAPSARQEGP